MKWRSLRSSIKRHLRGLFERGFTIVSGNDHGIAGDGQFVLASVSSPVRFRITRSRHEELIEFACQRNPQESDWFDIGYAQLLRVPNSEQEYVRLPQDLAVKAAVLFECLDNLASAVATDADAVRQFCRNESRRLNDAWR
jgi:threonine dehydrogenase-like Zn-dependent dehydrogenase